MSFRGRSIVWKLIAHRAIFFMHIVFYNIIASWYKCNIISAIILLSKLYKKIRRGFIHFLPTL